MRHRRYKWTQLALLTASVSGCIHRSDSTVQYAFGPSEHTYASPLGRLAAQSVGIKNDFFPQQICVAEPPSPLDPNEWVYETELAYILWLQTTQTLTQSLWSQWSFTSQTSCPDNDPKLSAYVIVGTGTGANVPTSLSGAFTEASLTCEKKQLQMNCHSTSLTLGIGGVGQASAMFFQSKPEQWVELRAASPARLALSPFVTWHGLAEELENTMRPTTAQPAALAAAKEWRRIVATGKHDLAPLVDFAKQLTLAQLIAVPDPVGQAMMQDFFKGQTATFTKTYKPEYAAFHTLLHEVGHQLGMDHADAPDKSSVTGASSVNGQLNADGQWVTKEAAMSYGDAYLRLTADDTQGMAAQWKAMVTFYNGKK